MMLSTSAARIGSMAYKKIRLSHSATERVHRSFYRPTIRAFSTRDKSTKAVAEEEEVTLNYELDFRTRGHAAIAALNANQSHREAWMVNLGRNDDNRWLTGPRPSDWYTGVHPSQCPGVQGGTLSSVAAPDLSQVTRQVAKDYFDNSWSLFEMLFAGLNGEEGFYRPPVHGLRHPQIFYYGHTACLYVNKLRVAGILNKPVNPYFESIFEVGVDEMTWDDMHKNDMVWPTVSEVHAYKSQVYETVLNAIMTHPSLDDSQGPIKVDQKHPMWALFMGCEHERIHLETSSVLFREMPFHLVQVPKHWPSIHPSAYDASPKSRPVEGQDYPVNEMIAVSGKTVDLGKPNDFPSYGWDNEYGKRSTDVPDFYASRHMITNGEMWEFVAEGGYRSREWWCDEGWNWRTHHNMKWPFFWETVGPAGSHEYALRTVFNIIAMPWSWPVDVNFYEAKAFSRWKTAKDGSPTSLPLRLLTEAEHHLLRDRCSNLEAARADKTSDRVMTTAGSTFAEAVDGANLNLAYSSQSPVDFFASTSTGHRDVAGNAWEWTEDHFNPLEGFECHRHYEDFSTPCFDGKHHMIVGGSFISTGDEASVFARFHFRPHFLQHSGFRLVASDADAPATHLDSAAHEGDSGPDAPLAKASSSHENVYETEDALHMYLGLHYPLSGGDENVPPILPHANEPSHGVGFLRRVVHLLKSLKPHYTNNRALDIGCAVGGASFELARTFNDVDAFDFSESFVNTAICMQEEEVISFRVPVEADIFEEVKAVHDDGISSEIRKRVHFFTGDACKLEQMSEDGLLATYDGAIMSNLLCRLPEPMACLDGLPLVMNQGGVVVMVTPFSWLAEFTPRDKWMGGYYDPVTREPVYSKDILRTVMEERGFEQIHEEEMPLVIREHQRKYQYIVSLATGWRKV